MSIFGGGLGGQVKGLVILSLFIVSRGNPGRPVAPGHEPPGVHDSDGHKWGHGTPEAYYCTIHHDVLCGYADMPFHFGGTGDYNPAKIVRDGETHRELTAVSPGEMSRELTAVPPEPQPETWESNTQVNPANVIPIDCQVDTDLTLGTRSVESVAFRLTPSYYLIALCVLVGLIGVNAMESRPTTPPYILTVGMVAEWGFVASEAFMSSGPHPSRANSPVSSRPPSPICYGPWWPSANIILMAIVLMGLCVTGCDAEEVILADEQIYNAISDWTEVLQEQLLQIFQRLKNATLEGLAHPSTLALALEDDSVGSWYHIRVESKRPIFYDGPNASTTNETAHGFCPCYSTYVSSEEDVMYAYGDCHLSHISCGYTYQNVSKGFYAVESCVRRLWLWIMMLFFLVSLSITSFVCTYVLCRMLLLPPSEQKLWNFVAKNELEVGVNIVNFGLTPAVGDLAAVNNSVHAEWRNKFCWRHNLANLMRKLGFTAEGVLLEATSQNRRSRIDAGRTLLEHRDTIFAVRAKVLNKLARENVIVDNDMNRSIVNREVLNVVRSMSVAGGPFFNRDADVSRLISMMVSSVFLQTIYDEIGDEVAFGPEGRPL